MEDYTFMLVTPEDNKNTVIIIKFPGDFYSAVVETDLSLFLLLI